MESQAAEANAQPVPAEEVLAQLARIVASAGFASSPRLCRFLRFVVQRTLENDLDRLKEFTVALEVFDRDEKYDPAIDSIVRVEARRMRSKLKAYYDGPGSKDPVLIGLRPGSYVPLLRPLQAPREAVLCAPAPAPAAGGDDHVTIAVLPFVNMSPEPEQDYFCDGITEEIINALTTVEGVNVIARTSAFQFKSKAVDIREVGQRLGARFVVEGSVRKAGDQLRITAQAIDATTGHHLWSETFRRKLEDVFAIQEEISAAIAKVLHVKLGPGARRTAAASPPSLEAYTGFLRGMFLVRQQNVADLHAALDHFRKLVRLYPCYAQPYAGIAACYGFLSLFGVVSGREVLPEMRRNAEEALRLDPGSAEAWAVMAGISAHWDYDWGKGEDCFRRAIAVQPGNPGPRSWYGMMMAAQGRLEEAQTELRKAIQANPLAASDHTRAGYVHYLRREDLLARAQYDKAFQLYPDFPEGTLFLGLPHLRANDYEQAAEVLSRNLARLPLAAHMGLLSAAYFRWGKNEQGRAMLQRLDALAARCFVTPLAHAFAYMGLGDLDNTFDCLERAILERTVMVDYLNVDPFYEPLKKDARFGGLLARLNLA